MENRQYEPVPIPLHQKIREFRVRGLPVLVFLTVGAVVALLWEQRIHSPGLIGQVVAGQSVVASPGSGLLAEFSFREFDDVRQGDLLGYVVPEDSLVIAARLNVIRSEIEMIRQGLDPVVGEQRNRINLEELKIDQIHNRISLAEDRLRLRQAEADYNRLAGLRERELVSLQEYELARTELDLLGMQVEEKENLTVYLDERIGEIASYGGYESRSERDPVLASIRYQEQRIEALLAEMAPLPVYAPMDGVVSRIHSGPGQHVEAGLPIAEIESREPTHIVGYVRQPFTTPPEVGMQVEVRTRKPGREYFISHIERLGGHFSLIREDLQRPGSLYESGLPVQIALGDQAREYSLTPGEIVDIVLRPSRERD